MNENELYDACVLNYNAIMATDRLRQYLLTRPGEEISAEVVGSALDALLDVGNPMLLRLYKAEEA